MIWFISAIVLVVIGLVAFIVAAGSQQQIAAEHKRFQSIPESQRKYDSADVTDAQTLRRASLIAGFGSVLVALLFLSFSTIFFQSVGQAKIIVNADGSYAGEKLTEGVGFKAPWQNTVDFDTFSQELLYAGKSDEPPAYSGGTVAGSEVTVSVGGIDGGSTQAFVDISIVYSIDPEKVTEIWRANRSQERFTELVVSRTALSAVREVPSDYTASEFRGGQRSEATEAIQKAIETKLGPRGVTNVLINIQDIRFSETVEKAISAIEEANQKVQEAEAQQRTVEVQAETARIKAQGEADANAILTQSLTPEVLQQRYIDALSEGTVYVVPDGSTPFVGTK